MGDHSAIEWTDATWNPVAGCTRVSAGCDHCYAATLVAGRLKNRPQYKDLAVRTLSGRAAFNGTIRLLPERLEQPLHWRTPRRVFVNSMSDLFHEDVPAEFIFDVFRVMERAHWHTFQVLTKRPGRMSDVLGGSSGAGLSMPPLPNVWLGVSAENQDAWDERVEILGRIPAAVRFVSAEPLLGPIYCGNAFDPPVDGSDYQPVDWVIVGAESGPGARPMNLTWARDIVRECRAADVPVFVKQLGAKPFVYFREQSNIVTAKGSVIRCAGVEIEASLDLDDPKGGDPAEWPEDLRVREHPQAVPA